MQFYHTHETYNNLEPVHKYFIPITDFLFPFNVQSLNIVISTFSLHHFYLPCIVEHKVLGRILEYGLN